MWTCSRFPDWLDRWMLCRKQLGLLALALAFLHVLYTFIIPIRYAVRHKLISTVVDEVGMLLYVGRDLAFSQATGLDRFSFLPQMKDNKSTPFYFDNTEAWATDSFFMLGIMGFFLYLLLGLTSLPSVGGSLSWREFTFVQVSLTYPHQHVYNTS